MHKLNFIKIFIDMKIIKTFLLTFVAVFALASCDSDDPSQTVQYRYSNNITYVTDYTTNASASTEGAYYLMDFDLISGKVNIEITNLRLTLGGSPVSLKIEQASFGQDKDTGAAVVNVPNATSVIGGVSHDISNFRLSQSNAYFSAVGQVGTYYAISFELDNQYKVVAVAKSAYLPGSTIITANADGSVVNSSNRPYYSYVLDRDKSTATVAVYYLDDKNKMYPELAFENLPYTLTDRGIIINVEDDVTAKQPSSTASPFVAKAISMESHFDSSTQIRIMTEDNLITASLSYRAQTSDKN